MKTVNLKMLFPSAGYHGPAQDSKQVTGLPGGLRGMGPRRPMNSGFTLMEILVAVFILGIVMATVLGTFTGIIGSSRDAEKKAELYQTGRALLDLIATDIRGIYRQEQSGSGPFFVGEPETVEGRSMSRVDFVTTNALTIGHQRNPFLSETGYRVKKNRMGHLFSLWRRSQAPPEYPFEEGGKEIPICRIVENFRLEFVYNNDKRDSLQYAIPQSVIIHLTINLDGEKETFLTMVRPMITS